MLAYFIVLVVLFVLAVVAAAADASETEIGIKAGVAVEGNSAIDWIWRTQKPTFGETFAYDLVRLGIFAGLGVAGELVHGKLTFGIPFAIAALIALGLKHYQGARQWAWLIKNPGKTIAEQETTAWQKLVGFWG